MMDTLPIEQIIVIVEQVGQLIAVLIVAFMGMLSTRLTSWVRSWGWLTAEGKSKVSGVLADVTSGVSSLLVTIAVLGIGWAVGWLNNPDTQTFLAVTFFTWTSAWGLHKVNKVARGIRDLGGKS